MVKKAFVISAVLVTIIIVISIIISLVNLKPVTFKRVVSYDDTYTIKEAPNYSSRNTRENDSVSTITNLLKYEKTITISTIVVIFIFIILFYGTKRSKGW